MMAFNYTINAKYVSPLGRSIIFFSLLLLNGLTMLTSMCTHQYGKYQCQVTTRENGKEDGVGHEQWERGGQRSKQVSDAAEDQVELVVMIPSGPVLISNPSRENLTDCLSDTWNSFEKV